MGIEWMIIAENEVSVKLFEKAGIPRIMCDLEYLNKEDRQRGRNTHISKNVLADVKLFKNAMRGDSKLVVRTNPIHSNSNYEINRAIEYGADIVMLPMAKTLDEVKEFLDIVSGRRPVIIMIETSAMLFRMKHLLVLEGLDEVFVGLNDLHISLELSNIFEILALNILDDVAASCEQHGVRFGFGGVGPIGMNGLVSPETLLAHHIRLKSECTILSRSFKNHSQSSAEFKKSLSELNFRYLELVNDEKIRLEIYEDIHTQIKIP